MAVFLLTQTVTELHPLKPLERTDIIVITMASGRTLYVEDYETKDMSIFVQLRSFTPSELGLIKRKIHMEESWRDTPLKEITRYVETGVMFKILGALSWYSSPLTRLYQPRLCLNHNTGFLRPVLGIKDKSNGVIQAEIRLKGFGGPIEKVTIEH